MSYCTADQVRNAWADKTSTDIPDTDVTPCINKAESIINAYLNNVYDVPFADGSVPQLVESLTIDIGVYCVKQNKDPRLVVDNEGLIELRYETSIDILKKLNKGILSIPDESQKEVVGSTTEDYHPIFNLDDEKYWEADEDLLDEIADDRES